MVSRSTGLFCICAAVALSGLALVEPARGSGCYSSGYRSYSYGYSYPSYSYPTTYIYKEKVVPVASFLGIPIPIYGALYTGPTSAAAYTTSATSASGGVTSADFARAVKLMEGISSRLDTLDARISARLDSLEGRLRLVEARTAAGAPPAPAAGAPAPGGAPAARGAVEPRSPEAPAAAAALPDALKVTVAKCALCHQEGNEARGKKLVLLTKDGSRAALSADQLLALNEVLKEGRMPPAPKKNAEGKPDHDIVGLTEPEAYAMLMDVKNFPKR